MLKRKIKAPELVDFEITYVCNCRCRMCPLYGEHTEGGKKIIEIIKKKKELRFQEIKNLVDHLSKIGVKRINLTGGEPSLRKDFTKIVKYIKKSKIQLSIISNGSINLRGEKLEEIIKHIDFISFSLDGPKEIHNYIRNNNQVFENLMKTIDQINFYKKKLKLKTPRIGFGCAVSTLNQKHLHKLVRIAKLKKADTLQLSPVFFTDSEQERATDEIIKRDKSPKGESQQIKKQLHNIDIDLLYKEIKKSKELAKKYNVKLYTTLNTKKDIINRFYNPCHHITNRCFYPWHTARMDPFGNVYPCSMNLIMGNIRKQKFINIWRSNKYHNFRKELKQKGLFPKCAKCCALKKHHKWWDFLPKGF